MADRGPAASSYPRQRRRPRRRWFALLASILGSAAVLALCELLLQTFDVVGLDYEAEHLRYRAQALRYAWDGLPPAKFDTIDLDGTLYRHKPSLDLDLGRYRLRTNRLGFRGPEVTIAKPAGTVRILMLGDSVLYGTGVADEVTFARRWEGELNRRGHRRHEVVNTGHPMYDSVQEAALLRDEGLRLQPDLVLLVYVVNDVEPTRDVVEQALLGRPARPEEELRAPGDLWTWLGGLTDGLLPATSKLLQLQSDAAVRWLATQPAGTEYVPERVGKGPRGWLRSQQALLAMQRQCRAAGVPFVVLDHTMPAIRALPGFCAEHGIAYHEFRFTAAELRLPIRNSMLDAHSNAAGHELLLQKLVRIAADLPVVGDG